MELKFRVKEKYMTRVRMMQKLDLKKVQKEVKPRSRGGGNPQESRQLKNFEHTESPTSRSATGARSVLPEGPRIGLTSSWGRTSS
jgi:hypothetical protein